MLDVSVGTKYFCDSFFYFLCKLNFCRDDYKIHSLGMIIMCDYLKKKSTTTYRANSHEKNTRRQPCTDVITVLNAAFRIFPRAQVRSVIMTPTKITGASSPSFGILHIFLSNNLFSFAELMSRTNENNIIYQLSKFEIFDLWDSIAMHV